MKNLFCIFTICLLIVSCSTEEKQSVNTGSELNGLVLANKKVVSQEITLEEISSYYGDEQREIFGLLTPENRKRLWEEKFNKLLISTEDEDEKALLNRIYDEVKELDFNENISDDAKERLNTLLYEGISVFEWDNVYVIITFSSFEFYQGMNANYNVFTMAPADTDDGGSGGAGGIKPNCNCTWGWGCILTLDCKEGSDVCKKTDKYCGWFWLDPCTGRCSET